MTNLVSIIITNHNYGEYLAEAVESALAQSVRDKEIIVVDDGSTDHSPEVIARYAGSITPIFKENGGHCSAANAGFAASRGDIVIFLDADDRLDDTAAHTLAAPLRADRSVSRSQGYLAIVNEAGVPTGRTIPGSLSPSGDYRARTLRHGPAACRHAFTSGNAWARWFLDRVMPLPEAEGIGVDGCLSAVSTLVGRTASIDRIVGTYRVHDRNMGPTSRTFSAVSLRRSLERSEFTRAYLAGWAERLGHTVPVDLWRYRAADWRHSLAVHSLALMERQRPRRFADLALAPFSTGHTSRPKALVVSVLLGILWWLPRKPALSLARRMLQLPKADA
jgi:glycosyltransferase involved in cell wall biosynthesis